MLARHRSACTQAAQEQRRADQRADGAAGAGRAEADGRAGRRPAGRRWSQFLLDEVNAVSGLASATTSSTTRSRRRWRAPASCSPREFGWTPDGVRRADRRPGAALPRDARARRASGGGQGLSRAPHFALRGLYRRAGAAVGWPRAGRERDARRPLLPTLRGTRWSPRRCLNGLPPGSTPTTPLQWRIGADRKRRGRSHPPAGRAGARRRQRRTYLPRRRQDADGEDGEQAGSPVWATRLQESSQCPSVPLGVHADARGGRQRSRALVAGPGTQSRGAPGDGGGADRGPRSLPGHGPPEN